MKKANKPQKKKKKSRMQKNQKKLKKETEHLQKIEQKKSICDRPGEDFSLHPHFRKQQIFFYLTPVPEFQSSGLQERDSGISVFL